MRFVKTDVKQSWQKLLLDLGVRHVVFALGFQRDILQRDNIGVPPIFIKGANNTELLFSENSSEVSISKHFCPDTGMIANIPSIFGAGIAFPHSIVDSRGISEPWVGFGFGIRNVQGIIDVWDKLRKS